MYAQTYVLRIPKQAWSFFRLLANIVVIRETSNGFMPWPLLALKVFFSVVASSSSLFSILHSTNGTISSATPTSAAIFASSAPSRYSLRNSSRGASTGMKSLTLQRARLRSVDALFGAIVVVVFFGAIANKKKNDRKEANKQKTIRQ